MNLKDLVPPLELCQQIPAGEFEDAAFAWMLSDVVGFTCRTSGCEQFSGQEWQIIRSNASRISRARKRGEQIYPAPTLQEIMAEFVILTVAGAIEGDPAHWMDENKQFATSIGGTHEFYKNHSIFESHCCCPVPTNATDALTLWFRLEGIEK